MYAHSFGCFFFFFFLFLSFSFVCLFLSVKRMLISLLPTTKQHKRIYSSEYLFNFNMKYKNTKRIKKKKKMHSKLRYFNLLRSVEFDIHFFAFIRSFVFSFNSILYAFRFIFCLYFSVTILLLLFSFHVLGMLTSFLK